MRSNKRVVTGRTATRQSHPELSPQHKLDVRHQLDDVIEDVYVTLVDKINDPHLLGSLGFNPQTDEDGIACVKLVLAEIVERLKERINE